MINADELYSELTNQDLFFLISGPCVVEDEKLMMETAEFLKKATDKLGIKLIFKSSYEKSNRTNYHSFSGPGMDRGLKILRKIKETYGLPILTDVHESHEVDSVAEVADILQIPAFLSRQTWLISAAAKTGKIINIKKGQFLAPEDMWQQAEKVTVNDNYKVMLTERGTTFGYHNLVVDFRSFALMQKLNFPVVYDVTHSMQRPSISRTTGGTPEFAPMLAQAAIASGNVDGLFIEAHPSPVDALSDANTQLELTQLPELLERCIRIKKAL
ncbi:MAG TPA: 3-deoxy-8-phosphooctulonate synthase [Candidatus Cloacimonadota bacterium]|nr:3-deoxy-8-phosphooctulonate synthase [Candidatus Cloacimonadota bacterium]